MRVTRTLSVGRYDTTLSDMIVVLSRPEAGSRVTTRPRRLRILGSRGIPNRHGGFEACAQHLAPWLVERGWDVTVYCQEPANADFHRDTWRGVSLEHVPTPYAGPLGSIWFDAWTARDAARHDDLLLTLGFNTAVLFPWYRLRGRRHVVNMDGVEWRRGKWSAPVRGWFWANSWVAGYAANHLIADHPEIAAMLADAGMERDARRWCRTAPIASTHAPVDPLRAWALEPRGYGLVIARPEPENSVLEIVRAWSAMPRALSTRGARRLRSRRTRITRRCAPRPGPTCVFPGALYDTDVVQALRHHARLYVHGHTVGGTNPSLVEALGRGIAGARARQRLQSLGGGTRARATSPTPAGCARRWRACSTTTRCSTAMRRGELRAACGSVHVGAGAARVRGGAVARPRRIGSVTAIDHHPDAVERMRQLPHSPR